MQEDYSYYRMMAEKKSMNTSLAYVTWNKVLQKLFTKLATYWLFVYAWWLCGWCMSSLWTTLGGRGGLGCPLGAGGPAGPFLGVHVLEYVEWGHGPSKNFVKGIQFIWGETPSEMVGSGKPAGCLYIWLSPQTGYGTHVTSNCPNAWITLPCAMMCTYACIQPF